MGLYEKTSSRRRRAPAASRRLRKAAPLGHADDVSITVEVGTTTETPRLVDGKAAAGPEDEASVGAASQGEDQASLVAATATVCAPVVGAEAAEELAVQVVAMARLADEVNESEKEFRVVALAGPTTSTSKGAAVSSSSTTTVNGARLVDAGHLEYLLNTERWRIEHAVQTTTRVERSASAEAGPTTVLVTTPTFVLSRKRPCFGGLDAAPAC